MAAKSGSEAKRLYRSEKDRIFGGVAGGLAEYFDYFVPRRRPFVLFGFMGDFTAGLQGGGHFRKND